VIIKSTFKPAWWLKNQHLQTIYPALFRNITPHPDIWRERLVTPDHDFIDIDFCGKGEQPLVIMFHGLTGSSGSGYIKGLQIALLKQGFRSAVLNFRGCSGQSNDLARCYHSGDTEDIQFVFQHIRQREPDAALAVVGFSLGGNALLKWLGEQSDNVKLFAASAVSVPFVLSECATKLDSGFSMVYRKNLIDELKDYMRIKQTHLEKKGKQEEVSKIKQCGDMSKIKSFWQYDDQVVAKLHGFSGVNDYYQKSSSRQFLKSITVPTLLIQASDDPFMSDEVMPQELDLSAHITLEITESGGHVGFVSGRNPLKPEYWLDQRIPEFLEQQLNAYPLK